MSGERLSGRILDKVQRHLGENADDDLFAKAMTEFCEGFPPDCSHAFTCLHGGECFRGDPAIRAARVVSMAAAKHDGAVSAYLHAAAAAIRSGSISIRRADIIQIVKTERNM